MHYLNLERRRDFERLARQASADCICIALTEEARKHLPPDWPSSKLITIETLLDRVPRGDALAGEAALLAEMLSNSPFAGAARAFLEMLCAPGSEVRATSRHPAVTATRALLRSGAIAAREPLHGGPPVGRDVGSNIAIWFGAWPHLVRLDSLPASPPGKAAPTIGVIMPAHNAEATIARTTSAILAGLGPADRLIVIENGSNDRTRTLLNNLYPGESRLIVESLPLADAAAARSHGVLICACDYVAFCDADDLWASAKPAILRDVLIRTDADMLLHPLLTIRNGLPELIEPRVIVDEHRKTSTLLGDLLLRGNIISTSAFAVRRSLFKTPAFSPGLRQTQDYEAWCRLALDYPNARFAYLDVALAFYRHWGGLSHNVRSRIANVSGIARVYSQHLPMALRMAILARNAVRTFVYVARESHPLALAWQALMRPPDAAIGAPRK